MSCFLYVLSWFLLWSCHVCPLNRFSFQKLSNFWFFNKVFLVLFFLCSNLFLLDRVNQGLNVDLFNSALVRCGDAQAKGGGAFAVLVCGACGVVSGVGGESERDTEEVVSVFGPDLEASAILDLIAIEDPRN